MFDRRTVTTDKLAQAGKVIAVHINCPSRAAERGRTPGQPSYFLKPSSSLALTGGSVERPAGCELLGFEGEIAVVIGRTARRVSIEDAWSYVGGVTASNDLGVHDLRWADKGSNLRSMGGDGFTPPSAPPSSTQPTSTPPTRRVPRPSGEGRPRRGRAVPDERRMETDTVGKAKSVSGKGASRLAERSARWRRDAD